MGAGALLAKMGDDGLFLEGEEERILTLLSVAHGHAVSPVVLGRLRRASKHWRSGDKGLAAIHLAQSGLGKLDEEGAYRRSLTAKLIEAGVTPRELARELGLRLPADLVKYDPDQPRVPPGSGRERGEWTSSGDNATSDGATAGLIEGRSAGTNADDVNRVPGLPKDAVVVKRPDGSTIYDPDPATKRLMAPQRAHFQEVYAAGEKIASWRIADKYEEAKTALQQFGTYDFQRGKAMNTFFNKYIHASNYAVGVYMAGAAYGRWISIKIV